MTNPGTIPADHPELGTRQARDPGAGNPTSLGPTIPSWEPDKPGIQELGTRQARDPGAGNPTSLGPGTAGNPTSPGSRSWEPDKPGTRDSWEPRQARDSGAGNPTSLGPGTAGNPGHVHLEVINPGRSQLHKVSLGSLQEGDRSDSEESFHEVSLGSLQEGDRSDSEESFRGKEIVISR